MYLYCLPVMVGIAAGFAAYCTGVGLFGAFLVGFVIRILTLVAAQTVIRTSRSRVLRVVIVLLFVGPAVWARYSVTLEFVRWLKVPSVVRQYVYALFGAFMVGGTAFAHFTDPGPPEWL
jgi:heme/copper-type cytochrome/quinol oxidase subunit 4